MNLCGKEITKQKVRTALKKFEKMGFLINESSNKNRLIKIVNWGRYQNYSKLEDMNIGYNYRDKTWIKLHRSILQEKSWIKSSATEKVIKITLLLMIEDNRNETIWKKKLYYLQVGEMSTKLDTIKHFSGKDISIQNVRTALKNLEKDKFIRNISSSEGRLINIIDFKDYIGNKKVKDEIDDELAVDVEEEESTKLSKKSVRNRSEKEKPRMDIILEEKIRQERFLKDLEVT